MDKLLTVPEDSFRAYFNKKPFLVQHGLTDHPLFALPRRRDQAARVRRALAGEAGARIAGADRVARRVGKATFRR